MNKRKILIISSSVLVAGGLGYYIYTRFRNKKEIREIHAKLDGREGAYGSIEDFAEVFSGTPYINDMKAKHKNLILLRDEPITAFRMQLNDAIAGLGTDEDAIKGVFRTLKDRVHMAQVAASYQKHYNENLLDALKGEMDVDDSEMKELLEIMMSKPAFRTSK